MPYPKNSKPLNSSPNLPEVEKSIIDFWQQDDTFKESIRQRANAKEFVFYDGPPFANGLPHYGHMLTGYVKDVVPRYRTMRGDKVERRFGWDTHGLPAEFEAMRELGLTEKADIEKMGIAAFNNAARASVLKYAKEWEEYVTRQARWVDFENDYKTLDVTFMESVLWAFKTLYEKGRAYEGYKVLPYCWVDQTPLSSHELRMDDDIYQDRQDASVVVTFPLTGQRATELGLADVHALAWTTTPWTLPTNFSLAVGPEIEYVVVPAGPAQENAAQPKRFLLAKELVKNFFKELGYADAEAAQAAAEGSYLGQELEYLQYTPLWDVYAKDAAKWGLEKAWIITVADYVSTADGTGIVHQATAYGEEDQKVNALYDIPVVVSVDEGAKFLNYFENTELDSISGMQVFEANRPIIRLLQSQNRLFSEKSYVHSYPHCWRCRNPLIYKAVGSWFVKVADQRQRMLELNEEITWVPGNVKHGQFGKWLEGARDWAISRNRYWGTPIPIWKSDDPNYPRIDVYGSLAELEADFGQLPLDEKGEVNIHRPYIDQLTRPNPDDPSGKSTMRRIEDVFDVWFDSASMPFAQVHYPFENKEWFNTHNPADFIVEYIGQTRGWFYVMHVLATALFDRPAFTNVICHGIVLGNDGFKASKSRRNYPDPTLMFDQYGADAIRWFLMSSPILRGGNLIVAEEGIRNSVRTTILPLWSTWYFFALYANASGPKDEAGKPKGYEAKLRYNSPDPMDQYLLGYTRLMIEDTTALLDELDVVGASEVINSYLDTLTNWYVRRSRERFWQGSEEALDTLYTCLEALLRVSAPLLPLVSEEIWQQLTGVRSVHLTDWPKAEDFPPMDSASPVFELVVGMEAVREVAKVGNALRKKTAIRARQPLKELTVVSADIDRLEQFKAILADELNVKEIKLLDSSSQEAKSLGVVERLSVNARVAGPRLGKQVQAAIVGAKNGDWSKDENGEVTAGGLKLLSEEYTLEMVAGEGHEEDQKALGILKSGGFISLDTKLTAELIAEGLARDVIRAIQSFRREAGLEVSDRIELALELSPEAQAQVSQFEELIANEVLATKIHYEASSFENALFQGADQINDFELRVWINKA